MDNIKDIHEAKRLIIFSDLDGSLLDHSDYSWTSALPALERIQREHVPLIFCTSKTRVEVELIQKEICITDPFIVENGGGIFFLQDFGDIPDNKAITLCGYQCVRLGTPYETIRSFIKYQKKKFTIRGFGDMTVEEIAQLTGLSAEKAALAKERDFTEPFIVGQKQDLVGLEKAARNEGLRITKGGRFYHLVGYGNNKGAAVRIVKDLYSRSWQSPILSVGLGDSMNDISMLEQVEIPVLIPHDDGLYENTYLQDLIKAPYPGSKGWNHAVHRIMDQIIPGT
ncbi:MAG: mannosyl-3-phosphoglycerate phosphatase [Deltaproteobacteria bacterium HGW-Deltaproteobacteria-1]|jgi:mannosyl-3-phosphoglycerate phosphatase|nr:MAG: mannosyl-3-phosphoglycerate phosphatase [Deltaproteobacteria bacterium HGW-Deltaproteobacteria-1]